MLYKRQGFPEEGEILLCTVDRITYNSVFVKLDEYENLEGIIHISEISPGRIRNLRDYVREGKKIICKVLRADPKTQHIELSLRRVNEHQKAIKNNELKQEIVAEKVIELAASRLKIDTKKLYDSIASKVLKDYNYIFDFFSEAIKDNSLFNKYKIPKKTAEVLLELIKDRIKPKEAVIDLIMSLETYQSDGIGLIKKVFTKLKEDNVKTSYLGGCKYRISFRGENFKDLEKEVERVKEKITKIVSKIEYTKIEFKRDSSRKR